MSVTNEVASRGLQHVTRGILAWAWDGSLESAKAVSASLVEAFKHGGADLQYAHTSFRDGAASIELRIQVGWELQKRTILPGAGLVILLDSQGAIVHTLILARERIDDLLAMPISAVVVNESAPLLRIEPRLP